MEVWGDKVLVLFLMEFLTLGVGLAPIWLLSYFKATFINKERRNRLDRCLSLMNCFVGGVFISTTLLHLLPEAREATEKYLNKLDIDADEFAVTEFTVLMGFFIIMFLEHFVMVLIHKHKAEQTKEDKMGIVAGDIVAEHTARPSSVEIVDDGVEGEQGSKHRLRTLSRSGSLALHGQYQIKEDECQEDKAHGHSHGISPDELASLRSFMLLLAIGIHTIFEGLAIGLQHSANIVWNLFIAIIIHKLIIVFSLGFNFAENLKHKRNAILFIVIFATLSPIGIAIGTGLVGGDPDGESVALDVINGMLQGISTGTLLYCSFFEILMGEVGSEHSLLKVLLVMLGFVLMTLLQLFNHEPEGAE